MMENKNCLCGPFAEGERRDHQHGSEQENRGRFWYGARADARLGRDIVEVGEQEGVDCKRERAYALRGAVVGEREIPTVARHKNVALAILGSLIELQTTDRLRADDAISGRIELIDGGTGVHENVICEGIEAHAVGRNASEDGCQRGRGRSKGDRPEVARSPVRSGSVIPRAVVWIENDSANIGAASGMASGAGHCQSGAGRGETSTGERQSRDRCAAAAATPVPHVVQRRIGSSARKGQVKEPVPAATCVVAPVETTTELTLSVLCPATA